MSLEPDRSKKDAFLLICGAIIWGTSFLFVKISIEYFEDFFVSLFFRILFAFIISLLVFFIINIRTLRFQLFYFKRKTIYLLSILNTGGYFFQFMGAVLTTSSKIALLVNSTAIFVPIISYFMLKEKFNYKRISGIFIGIIGLIFLTTKGDFQSLLEGEFLGDIYCLIGGIFWAFYIALSRKALIRNKTTYEPINLALITTVFSFIFLLPFVPFYYTTFLSIFPITSQVWLELLYLGIFCTTIAYIFYFIGLRSISATKASFILLLEPTIAIILGIIFLNDFFNIFSIVGVIFILTAILIINIF